MAKKLSKEILKAIWEDYAPRVGDKNKIDPDVLWVGSFLEGLLEFMPELWYNPGGNWDPSQRAVRPEGRRGAKLFFMDVLRNKSRNMGAGDVVSRFIMQRERWGKKGGEPVRLLITRERAVDLEPGALTFEPVPEVDVETGKVLLVDPVVRIKGQTLQERVRRPTIRVDAQFGLHYLLRGDKFIAEWVDRRKESHTRVFELRPKAEGTSEVIPERREDLVVF